jgi:hypothetical protein
MRCGSSYLSPQKRTYKPSCIRKNATQSIDTNINGAKNDHLLHEAVWVWRISSHG